MGVEIRPVVEVFYGVDNNVVKLRRGGDRKPHRACGPSDVTGSEEA
jgi:hypothetical protein